MNQCCCNHAPPPASPERQPLQPRAGLMRFRIEQMDCPNEEALIRPALEKLPEVHELQFDLIGRVLGVRAEDLPSERVIEIIASLGMQAQPLDAQGEESPPPAAATKGGFGRLALAGGAALAAEVAHWLEAPSGVAALAALLAIALCGLGVYRKGWIALRHGQLNINALMSLAVTGAAAIGQWPEAAMVMVLFALAERIEAASLERARQAIHSLMALAPERAEVRDEQGHWHYRPLKDIEPGARARVKPGERVGLDGEVLAGHSSVDQSPITGESAAQDRAPGDKLYAGSINGEGLLEYRVESVAKDSTVARIVRAVEQAQASRAPTQRFIDRFARVYTPAVVLLAVLVALLPPLWLGDWLQWTYRALVLLVVACPCALVISTPVSVVSGLAAAARRGILIKGGAYLESARHIRHLALDKTGTLTLGRPSQTDREELIEGADSQALASLLASHSEHPVSQAIAAHGQQASARVERLQALPGKGLAAEIDGKRYSLGNRRLLEELGFATADLLARIEALESQGKSVVSLCDEQRPLALFAVADSLRAEAQEAIERLHQQGIRISLLSGDNRHAVKRIADQLGIDNSHAELLPGDKLQIVARLCTEHPTAMAGDGINDAPALARADLGIAMGVVGSDVAIETADVSIMDDDLRRIPALVALSRRTARILKQNIVLALGIKAAFLVVAVMGAASLWMAVFADVGVSLLVVANGLRLLNGNRP